MEIWKDVRGYEGLYQVSNLGRVRHLEHRVVNHPNGSTRLVKEKILSPTDNGYGYKVVGLRKNAVRKNHYLHRLVALAFVDNPKGKKYVNHLDYDRSNNIAANLEWCTQSENVQHSVEHMKKPKAICRKSRTGEKYITIQCVRGKTYFRVQIRSKGVDKNFKCFDDAVCFRTEVMRSG